MKARILEVPIGSCYAWDCPCGREMKVGGPSHIQPTRVVCKCGAIYDCRDEGEVVVVAEAPPVVEPEPQSQSEPERPDPPVSRPIREGEFRSRPITDINGGAKKGRK